MSYLKETFTDQDVQAVWLKGTPIPGKDPNYWRRDTCGATMYRANYGDTNSSHGWEIDHINPVSRGGTDDLSNLRPLQWQNNRAKGDNLPGTWRCAVTS